MRRKLVIIIAVISIASLGAIWFFGAKDEVHEEVVIPQSVIEESQESPTTRQETVTYNRAELAKHNTKNDCWTSINNDVYDLTQYIPQHPGGDEILRACGTDGTSLFEQRKTVSGEEVGSGTPHSSSAQNQLESLKIGTLVP